MSAPGFERRPPAGRGCVEVAVRTDRTPLSGLVAWPKDEPRALVVAVHGAGMHAGYFDSRTAPRLSLMETLSELGYAVWAPDRPGVGASHALPDASVSLEAQRDLLLEALDEFVTRHEVGGDVVLVAHSFGLRVAYLMAASIGRLVGLDGAGAGYRIVADSPGHPTQPRWDGDRGAAWGPEQCYPPGAFDRARQPLFRSRAAQRVDPDRWEQLLPDAAAEIHAPVRLTFGVHDAYWPTDAASLGELAGLFVASPSVETVVEPDAGHNLGLGLSASAYHLRVAAFIEECLLRRRSTAAERPRTRGAGR